MGLPRKGSSKITVDGDIYRWVVSPDSGILYVAIQLESGKGSRLLVPVGDESPVTPGIVRELILNVRRSGWNPLLHAKPEKKKRVQRSPAAVKPPAVARNGGYRCPLCAQDSLHFIRDGYFACGSCRRSFVPEELRKKLLQ